MSVFFFILMFNLNEDVLVLDASCLPQFAESGARADMVISLLLEITVSGEVKLLAPLPGNLKVENLENLSRCPSITAILERKEGITLLLRWEYGSWRGGEVTVGGRTGVLTLKQKDNQPNP